MFSRSQETYTLLRNQVRNTHLPGIYLPGIRIVTSLKFRLTSCSCMMHDAWWTMHDGFISSYSQVQHLRSVTVFVNLYPLTSACTESVGFAQLAPDQRIFWKVDCKTDAVMDRKHFLDSQLWLLRLSKEAVEELQTDFKFHSLLTNAYCCFQIDKKIVYLSTGTIVVWHTDLSFLWKCNLFLLLNPGASSSYDSTQLLLEVLIAVDNDLERSAKGRHTSAPGLYFILDGVYYIVNHTHICNISVPQISANGEEPPSAFIGDETILCKHNFEIYKFDSRTCLIYFFCFFFYDSHTIIF